MMLILIATRTFITHARHIKQIALRVLKAVPVVAQTAIDIKPVTTAVENPRIGCSDLCQMLGVFYHIMCIVYIIMNQIPDIFPVFTVGHVTATLCSCFSVLGLYIQAVVSAIHLPPGYRDIIGRSCIACAVGTRSSKIIIDQSRFCLCKITLVFQPARCPASIPPVYPSDIAKTQVRAISIHRALTCRCHGRESLSGLSFCRDVDYADITIGTVAGRRCGYYLYVIDRCRRNLFKRLSAVKHTFLAIDINQKTGTSTKRDLTVSIDTHRRH